MGFATRRADDALQETAGYFDVAGRSVLSIITSAPNPHAGVVVCSPFQAEANSQYRWEVLLARHLTTHGLAVHRFDYRGTGASGGSLRDLTFDTMVEDALAAADHLAGAIASDRIGFFGIGFGGVVAAAASRHRVMPVALRGPTLEGKRYFREAFRAHRIAAMSDRPQDSPALDLAGALDGGETVDLMGNALAPAFYESARSRSLEDELGSEARPVLLTFAERDSRTAAAAEALADRLQGRGFDVTFELDPIADSFWLVGGDYAPVEDAPETASQLERVGNWFHRQLPLPSPAPPSRELPAPAAAPPADGAHPIFIPAAAETLFGMITVPATDTDTGAIVLQFGNSTMSTHRNGLWHRVAGSLAQAGVATLRFDYHGVGCSSGTASEFRTDRPFTTDLAAAADWMVKHGYNKLLLFGECYGARTAMAQAAAIPGLAGLFLVAPGLRDHLQPVMRANSWAKDYGLGRYVRRALSLETLRSLGNKQARVAYRRIAAAKIRFMGRRLRKAKPRAGGDLSWVSPAFIEQLQNVVDRRLPVHFVYGTADGHNDLRTAMQGELGRVAESGGDLVELTVREGKIHGGGTRLEVQDDIAGLAIKWASAVAPPAARTGG